MHTQVVSQYHGTRTCTSHCMATGRHTLLLLTHTHRLLTRWYYGTRSFAVVTTSSPHRHIETSLGALATQINFFIHNLAQFKFQASANAPALLSFCPQSYSIATDGKITSAIITSFHKRFYPETYYVSRYRWLGRGGR